MTTNGTTSGGEPCGAPKPDGTLCRNPAGWGTDHRGTGRCRLHGGMQMNHRKAGIRKNVIEKATLHAQVANNIDPTDALQEAVNLTYSVLQRAPACSYAAVCVPAVEEIAGLGHVKV